MKLVKKLTAGRGLYEVDVKEIQFDHSYQRPLSHGNKKQIKDNFDCNAVGIVHLCQRHHTKVLYAVDGQHRITAWRELIEEGSEKVTATKVLAIVVLNTTREYEADLFEKLNTMKPVTGNSKTRARLVSNKSPQKEINEILNVHGFKWLCLNAGRPSRHELQNCGVTQSTPIINAYLQHGHETFNDAIALLKSCWVENGQSDIHAMRGTFIEGLCFFVKTQGTIGLDVIARLKGSPVEDIMKSKDLPAAYSDERPTLIARWLTTVSGLKQAA